MDVVVGVGLDADDAARLATSSPRTVAVIGGASAGRAQGRPPQPGPFHGFARAGTAS